METNIHVGAGAIPINRRITRRVTKIAAISQSFIYCPENVSKAQHQQNNSSRYRHSPSNQPLTRNRAII